MEEVLKQYDKLLTTKKNLDGSVEVIRQSPFDTTRKHIIFTISNQYIGSAKWILKKLISMDTRRHDIVGEAMRHNMELRGKKDSNAMHRDLADFMATGSSFIN